MQSIWRELILRQVDADTRLTEKTSQWDGFSVASDENNFEDEVLANGQPVQMFKMDNTRMAEVVKTKSHQIIFGHNRKDMEEAN